MQAKAAKGYTLVELMVVVAIIGTISAIAVPSYQSYTCDTYIGQAVADMNVCALGMERHYSNGFTYAVTGNDLSTICLDKSPSADNEKFSLVFDGTPNATSFKIKATASTSCGGDMTLDQAGTFVEL
jgi:type IV pilus assembly protein PilE